MLNARGVEVCMGCEDKRAHGSACDTFLSLDKNIQLLKKLFFFRQQNDNNFLYTCILCK